MGQGRRIRSIRPLSRLRVKGGPTMLVDVMGPISLIPFWVMLTVVFGGRGMVWHAIVAAIVLGWLSGRVHARLSSSLRDTKR